MQFDFYQSGIKQATFYVQDKTIEVEGFQQPRSVLTKELDKRYQSKLHTSPQHFFEKYLFTPLDFSGNKLRTQNGEHFQKRQDGHLWIQRRQKPAVNLVVSDGKLVGCQIAVRNIIAVLIRPGYENLTVLKMWQDNHLLMQKPFPIASQTTQMVKMSDGTQLATEVFIPDDGQKTHPVILERTPYGREMYYDDEQRFVQRGYVLVIQDVRGRNDSQGEWLPMYYERDDGRDTINWLANQPWSNGNVGMIGGSYGGYVQWAAASSATPQLKALVSMVTAGGPFNDTIYKNGAPISGSLAWFFSTAEKKFNMANMQRNDWNDLMKVRPLSQIPVKGLGHEIPGFSKFMAHKSADAFMENMDWKTRSAQIHVPALIQSGWFDDNGVGTTEAIRATNHYPAGTRKLILGPWVHSGNAQYDLGPYHLGEHALRFDIDLQHVRWFDHFLNGVKNGIEKEPLLDYYTLNTDKWRTADSFPVNPQPSKLFLNAKKQTLDWKPSKKTESSSYVYDPATPTPHLIDVSANELEFPNDYTQVENRSDVISFTTSPLTTPMTITGWFKAIFYASSSAVDTDWVVRLTDVTPNGQSVNIADGVLNAKFRNDLSTPDLMTPGTIYQFTVETQKTSIKLPIGHRLRLDIASAAENLVFPNSNTRAGADSIDGIKATQTIYTGESYPSHLLFNQEND
ncbi:CocE/NonD family hydrolase [Lentilactobacillus hilgardii]|uniref:CocE/NonD family hydrolase n=1 Tax=Lentilactobacillus hilgardii TaxID=1588 RepID=UPI003FA54EDC